MYDRYDSTKGRYVTYEYQPKGDKFTRGLVETPRVYKQIQNMNTGYTYVRRTRTDEAQSLTVGQFRGMLPEELQEDLEKRTLYFDERKHDLLAFVPIRLEPPGIPLRFEVTEQHKGKRVWFLCPSCDRRVGKLYRVKRAFPSLFPVWGCQKCLGLTYPSQAGHKTLARDVAIVNGRVRVGLMEEIKANHRYRRRLTKLFAASDRLLSTYR